MKMKLVQVGADRGARNQDRVILMGDVEDIRQMRAFVGCDVEVTITPVLRFEVGDVVDYSNIIGEEPVLKGVKIIGGPFAVSSTLCWKIEGQVGVVADEALRKHVAGR